MDKIIIYGYGKLYHRFAPKLTGCEITAIADRQVGADGWKCDDADSSYAFIRPDQIREYTYDYVAISSLGNFEKIKQQLIGENGVPAEKIISLYMYVEDPGEIDRNRAEEINPSELAKLKEITDRDGLTTVDFINDFINEENNIESNEESLPDSALRSHDVRADSDNNKYYRYSSPYQIIYRDSAPDYHDPDISIYVVTHKEYVIPAEGIYKPITVGPYKHDGWSSDDAGDNIACLNAKINECTAMYWIWKNDNSRIVGINHYRRYFYNNDFRCRENMLDADRIRKLLGSNDIIVYRGQVPCGWTVEQEMRSDLEPEVYELGRQQILRGLKKYQPDYTDAFENVMNSHECYYCNMLVAPKDIYDAYCQWLFSFLIPVAESTDVSGFDAKNSRIIGFFAERMLTVWLSKQKLKITALPVYIPN